MTKSAANTPQTNRPIAIVILAAGKGTRMKSATPKVLHKIAGKSMLAHVAQTAAMLSPARQIVVIGAGGEQTGEAAKALGGDIEIAVQNPPRGTGDAVLQALSALDGFEGVVLVLYADTPLLKPQTLATLCNAVTGETVVAALGFHPAELRAYGRLVLNEAGGLQAIVEAKDASSEQLEISFCNAGLMAIDAAFLRTAIHEIDANNAKGEYYLTDLVAIARKSGKACAATEANEDEVMGVDAREVLAVAEQVYQTRARRAAGAAGVTLVDPQTVYFSHDTEIEADVVIEPNVFFGPGVKIKTGAHIKAFSHLEGTVVREGAVIGPFARLRPGADIGAEAKVGNFVEIKNAAIGSTAKVSHLSYIGDAEIGAEANIGAGVITCNYDGFNKHKTTIGAGAFVGSNSALVAPIVIGDGAYIGSGSVITKNVEADDLAVARGRQSILKGWAARSRSAKNK